MELKANQSQQNHQLPPVSGLHGGIYLAAAQGWCTSTTNLVPKTLSLHIFCYIKHLFFTSLTCLSWLKYVWTFTSFQTSSKSVKCQICLLNSSLCWKHQLYIKFRIPQKRWRQLWHLPVKLNTLLSMVQILYHVGMRSSSSWVFWSDATNVSSCLHGISVFWGVALGVWMNQKHLQVLHSEPEKKVQSPHKPRQMLLWINPEF